MAGAAISSTQNVSPCVMPSATVAIGPFETCATACVDAEGEGDDHRAPLPAARRKAGVARDKAYESFVDAARQVLVHVLVREVVFVRAAFDHPQGEAGVDAQEPRAHPQLCGEGFERLDQHVPRERLSLRLRQHDVEGVDEDVGRHRHEL
eukprot:3184870-Prymnesium_polylepis.2